MDIQYLIIPEYIKDLVISERDSSLKNSPLLKLNGPKFAILGDTHGAIHVSDEGFRYLNQGYTVIMLGDLVDRGPNSLMNLLYALEMSFLTGKVIIIRGNHESSLTNPFYGFLDELKNNDIEWLYDFILSYFASLPPAILLNGKILCVHGGIPSSEDNIGNFEKLPRDDFEPSNKVLFEILWNDPREYIEGFLPSTRGDGAFFFGEDVFDKFMKSNHLDYIIRGHEVKMSGIAYNFHGRMITVFSSEYHGGKKGILLIEDGKFKNVII
mgnify:CR=1 FL=1